MVIWKESLQRQPISCPSDVERFFVSPEESGEICLLTCILGNSGDIYFPKLNENQLVNFKSITEHFFNYLNKEIKICKTENEAKEIALNLSANSPYPVYFFKTDTSGEKLYEEFFTHEDEVNFNLYESIGVILIHQNLPFLKWSRRLKKSIFFLKRLLQKRRYYKNNE